METRQRRDHWDKVYAGRAEDEVSWFQARPATSLALIRAADIGPDAAIIDIGAGESRLVDALLDAGFHDLSVLDISAQALAKARARLGDRAIAVNWIEADVTGWMPARQYDLWHDRAAFHFLTEEDDQRAYVARLSAALRPGGQAIIATFAPDGPEKCSGLPIVRWAPAALAQLLGEEFALVQSEREAHVTPAGRVQHFQFSRFRRI